MSQSESKKWSFDEGLALVRDLEPRFAAIGWHAVLAGSVLIKGSSEKDLDVIALAHDSNKINRKALVALLRKLGWFRRADAACVREHWRLAGSLDNKHVEVWRTPDGRRVDVISVS